MASQSSSKANQSRSSVADDATAVAAPTAPTPTAAPTADRSTSRISKPGDGSGDSTPKPSQGSKQVQKTKSWYGSWPRVPKSAASTQVARETIVGGTLKPNATADFRRFDLKKAADSMCINEVSSSDPALPNIHEDGLDTGDQPPDPVPQTAEGVAGPENKTTPEDVNAKATDNGQEEGTEPSAKQAIESSAEQQAPAQSNPQRPVSGWFGWFGRSTNTEPTEQKQSAAEPAATGPAAAPAAAEAKPPEAQPLSTNKDVQTQQPIQEAVEPASQPAVQEGATAASGTSWFWSWSSWSAPVPPKPEPAPLASEPETPAPQAKELEDVVMQDAPSTRETAPEQPAPPPKAGSTWAFWSRDTSSAAGKKPAQQGEQGQLAVIGESSETQPKKANTMEVRGTPAKEHPLKPGQKDDQGKAVAAPPRESSLKKNKRVRPVSMEIDDVTLGRPATPKAETTTKPAAQKPPTAGKALPPNILLPSFTGTYKMKENPSIIKQIAQLLLRTQQSSAKHVYLTKEPPKIKKAIAIGVHGLFPANYLRPMIGQPTGTSIKFANHCAEAIRRWADRHGCEGCEIEKVALEGEGRIAERVENLWKLLLNWIDHIRNADLILIACHSQGVPVSIMLLAKLIELGIVASARVGVCAMAGVSLGPFPDYRSSMGILMGSAAELWEFADPQSEVSKKLEAAVKSILSYGARLTYIGSIDDQLVPLESAIYAPAHHPYIFRAVFIDGRVHAPDFIAHLVGFALKLRNLGVSDHGLIRELSTPLAGSLYSGEGHSRLYDDEQVYDLAVTHALETTDVVGNVPCEVAVRRRQHQGLANPNPYHLPWIMRGLLEEDFVKTELSAETAELVRQFDDWKPVSKALKDVKYRLEAVRSKL
ncbi:hypothetical protein VTK56DRAFT_6907 [Thermocarpiscus australiensis]